MEFLCLNLFKKQKGGRREGEREKEEKDSFYKFTEEFGQAIISETVKADKLFIVSY